MNTLKTSSCNMISYFIILPLLDFEIGKFLYFFAKVYVFLIVKPWPTFNYCDRVAPFKIGMHYLDLYI